MALHTPQTLEDSLISFSSVAVDDLSRTELAIWQGLVDSNPQFTSPFFTPGYCKLLSRCVPGVLAGLMTRGRSVVGVFPHEKMSASSGRPVGSVFCDYQGVIVGPDVSWKAERLLEGIGLSSWHFDHLIACQKEWTKYHRTLDVSWVVNLRSGYEEYETLMSQSGRGQLVDVARKRRMAEREVGPITFEPHVVDHNLLDDLLTLKSAQWARSGWKGRYRQTWERNLMHRLLEWCEPSFAGMFSVLRIGGTPAAMHIGMRSRRTLHYWTTGYNPEFKRYSPGLVMIDCMLRRIPALGLTRLDLGKEEFEYKRRFHTHTVLLAEGVATLGAAPRIA